MSKHRDIRIIRVPEGKEGERGPEKILGEVIAENFPNTGKATVNQVQEAENPRQKNPKEEHAEAEESN